MSTLTVYPNAGTGGANTTVDGYVERSGVNQTLGDIRGGAGTGHGDTDATAIRFAWITASTTDSQYARLRRGIYLFDTSSIASGATITSATFSLYGNNKANGLGSPDLDIVNSNPASNVDLVNGDYSTLGTTIYGSISYASFSTTAYNDISLNTSAVTKAGITKLGATLSWDTDNSFTGTWSSGATSSFYSYFADADGTTNDPKLVVVYETSSPSSSPSEGTPSNTPSSSPSNSPSEGTPSNTPSATPSSSPSEGTPSNTPSSSPSSSPSEGTPSNTPSATPSSSPSEGTPSNTPSNTPSGSPSEGTPSNTPSSSPSGGGSSPSSSPSEGTPSNTPSNTPSATPSEGTPSNTPSATPSEGTPSNTPSATPSATPSTSPSSSPSGEVAEYYKNTPMYLVDSDLTLLTIGDRSVATWNTLGRPTGKRGTFGFNTDLNLFEVHDGVSWTQQNTFGDSSNYATFDSTGHLTFHGEAKPWDDLMVSVTATRLGGSKDPEFAVFKTNGSGSQGVFTYWFDASAEEELYFAVQMPHAWDGGTVKPHVHWTPKTTADGTPANQKVEWGLEYTFAELGATFGNTSFVYGNAHTPADANVVAGKHYLTPLSTITPTTDQDGISSMMVCRLFRNATDATDDTYEADAGVLQFDIHYQIARVGSTEETSP